MASLTIRNIPETVMKRLRRAAADERRSLNSQAVLWLEESAGQWINKRELLERIRASREEIYKRHGMGSDSAEIIRRMRDERARHWT